MDESKFVLVTYRVSIIAFHDTDSGSPLPLDTNKEYLQLRCVVNGIPQKVSSSLASSYFVLDKDEFTVTNSFVVELLSGYSDVYLEWKKQGVSNSRWEVVNSANFSPGQSLSLSILADYKQLVYVHEKKDAYIRDKDTWIDVSDLLPFYTESHSNVVVGYSMAVLPQLGAIVRGENQDMIAVRIVVDDVPYRDGSSVFGQKRTYC
jgi:hypothetical protein